MRRRLVLCALVVLALVPAALPAPPSSGLRPSPMVDYRAQQDGPSFMAIDPAGRVWSVWSYRRGLEIDVAISMGVGRTWTSPVLVGTPGVDDLDPRIGFLSSGQALLVWWQKGHTAEENRVMYSILFNGDWTPPRSFLGIVGSSPSLFIGPNDEVTVAYQPPVGAPMTTSGALVKPVPHPAPDDPGSDGGTNGPDPMPTIIVKNNKS